MEEINQELEVKMKVCKMCCEELPSTKEYFHVHNGCKDGLNSVCKKCRSKLASEKNRGNINTTGVKKCVDCENILEINSTNFKTSTKSLDGYLNVCVKCQIKRRDKESPEGFKKCSKCDREFPISRDYFQLSKISLDGFVNTCLECNNRKFFPDFANEPWSQEDINIVKDNYKELFTYDIIPLLSVKRTEKSILHMAGKLGLRKIESYIENYNSFKYKIIDNKLHKYCKSCKRYLPMEYDYFPKDESCTDSYRNVCRECKGELFRFNSDVYKWSEQDIQILKDNYPHMTNKELYNTYFPFLSINKIMHRANDLGFYKTEETLQRVHDEIGKFHSERLIGTDKWKSDNNPQYDSKRFGSLNPNYKGGISALYQELRRNLKQWKIDSVENSNYVSLLTGKRFNDIHHLYSFDNIVKDTLSETRLPLYDDISFYSDEEIKLLVDKCLEIHYRHPLGVCLEERYHAKFHEEFGYGGNTEEQFYEFLDNYYNGKYKYLEEVS